MLKIFYLEYIIEDIYIYCAYVCVVCVSMQILTIEFSAKLTASRDVDTATEVNEFQNLAVQIHKDIFVLKPKKG